jgi:hypothetical protein
LFSRWQFGAGDIVERLYQPEADADIAFRIMTGLLKRPVQQAFEVDPGHDNAQDMRRPMQICARRRASCPANEDAAQLVDATDRGAGIVDSGRDRL